MFLCRPVILGTDTGKLLEVVLDEKDKRDAPVRQLYDFEDALEPIRGLEHQALQGDKSLVLVATPTRLYVLVGGPTLEAVFASYPESAGASTVLGPLLHQTGGHRIVESCRRHS